MAQVSRKSPLIRRVFQCTIQYGRSLRVRLAACEVVPLCGEDVGLAKGELG
ncbi:hypothetical protein HNP40_000700 [Mycobacteroides chelonae]|nr:hypothetical protein [Mycobacteroides chelonae]